MSRSSRWVWRAAVVLALIVLSGGIYIWHTRRPETGSTLPVAHPHAARAALLTVLERLYPFLVVGLLALLGLTLAGLLVSWRVGGRTRWIMARASLMGIATLLVLSAVEGSVNVYLSWLHRLPHLAMLNGAPRPASSDHVTLVVVGESSAEGVPYRDWLSVGKIVAWQLRRLLPSACFMSRFRPGGLDAGEDAPETCRVSAAPRRGDLLCRSQRVRHARMAGRGKFLIIGMNGVPGGPLGSRKTSRPGRRFAGSWRVERSSTGRSTASWPALWSGGCSVFHGRAIPGTAWRFSSTCRDDPRRFKGSRSAHDRHHSPRQRRRL